MEVCPAPGTALTRPGRLPALSALMMMVVRGGPVPGEPGGEGRGLSLGLLWRLLTKGSV